MTPLALLMHRDVEKVSRKTLLREAAVQMREKEVGSLMVCDGEEIIGIVSESDFVRKGLAGDLDLGAAPVESIMSAPVISIDIDETAKEANELMANKAIRHLAITDRGKVVGIISVRDLLLCYKNRI
ncbi:MAG: cyclic nucleotide-binding/CBS domain-containing protein [Nitrospiria bacterium]